MVLAVLLALLVSFVGCSRGPLLGVDLDALVEDAGGADAGGADVEGPITVMSLNIYGWATMPQSAGRYADLIRTRDPDAVGIQEGGQDWNIATSMPTDYRNAAALGEALGDCWERRYQLFVNTCKGNAFVSNRRFDLTDGPNATRTGESAVVEKDGWRYAVLTVHWDHESGAARIASAHETAAEVQAYVAEGLPVVVVGDLNAGCRGWEGKILLAEAELALIGNAGIDCIYAAGLAGTSETFDAAPSDHPGIDAVLAP